MQFSVLQPQNNDEYISLLKYLKNSWLSYHFFYNISFQSQETLQIDSFISIQIDVYTCSVRWHRILHKNPILYVFFQEIVNSPKLQTNNALLVFINLPWKVVALERQKEEHTMKQKYWEVSIQVCLKIWLHNVSN